MDRDSEWTVTGTVHPAHDPENRSGVRFHFHFDSESVDSDKALPVIAATNIRAAADQWLRREGRAGDPDPFDDGPAARLLKAMGVEPGGEVKLVWKEDGTFCHTKEVAAGASGEFVIDGDGVGWNVGKLHSIEPVKKEEGKCQSDGS